MWLGPGWWREEIVMHAFRLCVPLSFSLTFGPLVVFCPSISCRLQPRCAIQTMGDLATAYGYYGAEVNA